MDGTVPHWFDFVSPDSYVAQDRTALLRRAGRDVVDLPLLTRPEAGRYGAPARLRAGHAYRRVTAAAREAGLPLRWPARVPDPRLAHAAAEVVRDEEPEAHADLVAAVFQAHFAHGHDIGDLGVLQACATRVGLHPVVLAPLAAGARVVDEHLRAARALARTYEVTVAPTWLIDGHLVSGLQPRGSFASLAR